MGNYVVLHAEKCKGNLTGIGQHIDRAHTPHNADPKRAHLNEELVQPRSSNLTNDVNQRIKEGYTKKKAIRKDAVKAMRVVLSGSPEQMQRISKDEKQFREWKKANLEFFSERFGKANLVRFSLHMDETTPHIHAVVVPLSPDGELSAKKMFGGPKELTQLQTDYAEAMNGFGLGRGKENSTAKHTDIKEYYARVNNQEHLFPDVKVPYKKMLESEETFQKRGQTQLAPIFEALEKSKRTYGQLKGDNVRLMKQKQVLEKEQKELQNKIEGLKNNNEYLSHEKDFAYSEGKKAGKKEGITEGRKQAVSVINELLKEHKLKATIDDKATKVGIEPIEEKLNLRPKRGGFRL